MTVALAFVRSLPDVDELLRESTESARLVSNGDELRDKNSGDVVLRDVALCDAVLRRAELRDAELLNTVRPEATPLDDEPDDEYTSEVLPDDLASGADAVDGTVAVEAVVVEVVAVEFVAAVATEPVEGEPSTEDVFSCTTGTGTAATIGTRAESDDWFIR
jgi:hypothetical protein